MTSWKYSLKQNLPIIVASFVFIIMFAVYSFKHPAGLTPFVATTAANKGVLLALIAMAQTLPVLTAGIDLSVGMIFILSNCLASTIVVGTTGETTLGIIIVLLCSILCGMFNGAVIVYGRLQPIITTVATGSIFFGLSLILRPAPGGDVNETLADTLTGQTFGIIPTSLLVLLAIILLIWLPFKKSVYGRAVYAAGSSESAAYMSGLNIKRGKFLAYSMAGLFSGLAGLMLTFITYAGEANAALGGGYTLYSIASVVIGGTSLYGGVGGAVGSVIGAFVFRTIGDLLFVFDLDALYQPLFIGVVLIITVSLGAFRLLRVRNRLDLLK